MDGIQPRVASSFFWSHKNADLKYVYMCRGVDNIDVKAATSCGIIVVNSPAGNILAAAEHTIALLLATARNVGKADAGVKAGKWERGKLVGVEVGSKTLGIVGLGKVGMEVARMAIGLGMKVSRSRSSEVWLLVENSIDTPIGPWRRPLYECRCCWPKGRGDGQWPGAIAACGGLLDNPYTSGSEYFEPIGGEGVFVDEEVR